MRLNVLFTLITLMLSSAASAAYGQCSPVKPKWRLHDATPGFTPVIVYLKLPATVEPTSKGDLLNRTVRFWIEGHVAPGFDNKGYLRDVFHCVFGPEAVKKTYVRLYYQQRYGSEESETVLRTGMFFPTELVNRKPRAGASFADDVDLVSSWGTEVMESTSQVMKKLANYKKTYATLTLSESQ